jgi:hypothetical protein
MARNAPYVMVKLSPALKDVVEKAANDAGLDTSKWIRQLMADACGYDLSADESLDLRGRPSKYTSEQERKRARAKAQQERTARSKAVVNALMRQQHLANRAALEKWLTDRGISLDDVD